MYVAGEVAIVEGVRH